MKLKIAFALVLAAAVAGGLVGAVAGLALDGDSSSTTQVPAAASAAPPSNTTRATGLAPEELYRRAAPAVVVITDTQTQKIPATLFTPAHRQRVQALGSGFVINRGGDIVTNDHVVAGATNVRVGFSSGATYPATVEGTDPSTDVAVIHVQAPPAALHPLAFADSNALEVGDPVYAIGNPFGLDRTMTAGIVSATGRDIQAPDGVTIPNAIQTDAAINHGNSGGPLLDRFGRVVGINAQIEGGTVDANVGVGFAIPSDTAKSVAQQLISTGHARHAWLGVEVDTIDPALTDLVRGRLPDSGVIVAAVVKGSPAAKAGLKPATRKDTIDGATALLGGDVIVGVDGRQISSAQQLAGIIAEHVPGDRLTLEVVRNGKHDRTVTVTLVDVPATTP